MCRAVPGGERETASVAQLHKFVFKSHIARKAKKKMKLLKTDPAVYTDAQWRKACVLDLGPEHFTVKKRYAIPVRTPDGALSVEALAAAADAIRTMDAHELAKNDAHVKLAKWCVKAGVAARVPVAKEKLSTKQRAALPASAFVFPKTREYPIHDEEHARAALSDGAQNETGKRLAKIRAAVKRRYPNIDVAKADLELAIPIWKDDAKRIVYGVVLTPGVRDSQGDIVSAEDIEKAAHRFLTEKRQHDIQHDEEPRAIETVESFIAPQQLNVAGQTVLKGSWVLASHIADDDAWQSVRKGRLGGYSIGGTGVRLPD